VEMAGNPSVAKYDPKAVPEASIFLAQATNTAAAGGSAKVITDYSSRASARASEAIRLAVRKEYEEMVAAEESRKAAEKAALKTDLAATTAEKEQLAAEKKQLEADKRQLESDKAALQADKAALQAERDALAARLNSAVERIMVVRQSARGLVMDLGNVLFDVNKATLKPGAHAPLAKLAGVLLMLPEINVRIEGFTDSTGSAERNKVLSAERARSVHDYLVAEKIDPSRLTHAGYGPDNPAADNSTADGRTKNRRVELTLAQGAIEPTPGGFTAPDTPSAAK
jgi:outer membrane protein OmpA-like peptidoglycan-associated protein